MATDRARCDSLDGIRTLFETPLELGSRCNLSMKITRKGRGPAPLPVAYLYGSVMYMSRSLQGNAVPPQPIVHRPDVASERRRDISGTSVLLKVQVPKAPLGEDVTVFDSGRSHLRPHLMQPLVNRGDPHVESLRDFANSGAPVVQALDDLARKAQSVTVQPPAFPRLPGPSEDRYVVSGRLPLDFHQFRNGTAREP